MPVHVAVHTCGKISSDLSPYSVRSASLHPRNLGTRIESKKAHYSGWTGTHETAGEVLVGLVS